MGFTVYHGGAGGPGLGEALNQAGRNYLAGRQVADEEKRTDAALKAAKIALEEHEAKRQAAGALGRAQASMSVPESPAVQPQGPGSVEPEDAYHSGTQLPDYRDQGTLQREMDRLKSLRSQFPQTPEGDAAFGELANEWGQRIQGHILDNQEADAIDGLANRMASMSRQEDAGDYAERFKGIEQVYRTAKSLQNPAARAAQLKQGAELEQKLIDEYRSSRVRVLKQTSAQAQMQKYLGTLSAGDPRLVGVGALEAQIASAQTPEEVDDAYSDFVTMTQTNLMKGSDGAYRKPEDARQFEKDTDARKQQEVDNALASQKINLDYNEAGAKRKSERVDRRFDRRKQRETERSNAATEAERERHNQAMEGRPIGQQGNAESALAGRATAYAKSKVPPDIRGNVDQAKFDEAFDYFVNKFGKKGKSAEPAAAGEFDTSTLAPDELKEYESLSDDGKAAFRKAMGGG